MKHNVRRLTADGCRLAKGKNHIYFFTDLDITYYIERIKPSGISASAYLAETIAKFLADNYLHITGADYLKNKNQEIDIEVQVEKTVDGCRIPYGYILRDAAKKSSEELQAEIAGFREKEEDGTHPLGFFPGFLRRSALRIIMSSFGLRQKYLGTISLTSVGSVSRHCGYVQPLTLADFCLAAGSREERGGRWFQRFTFVFNHDLIDGGDCGRFIDEYQEILLGKK
ncbi:hypothetical protein [Breznakiella homolactica]|uniref:2-oxoacid dehydrogenase acyltransferase catalytic domain-containing protein n=1 Tax=Breznakiella homolactica TaxID=2798577 RepID=A0A7T7XPH6_9SPIR|nr:hypothetical protein [Breznakiella homolactica]QQO10088.1 hypothetical protein JFL75_03995 [Breznakiella homolactica]